MAGNLNRWVGWLVGVLLATSTVTLSTNRTAHAHGHEPCALPGVGTKAEDGTGYICTSVGKNIARWHQYHGNLTPAQRASGSLKYKKLSLGGTGPGGGVVVYISDKPFKCGPKLKDQCRYLEAAPPNWWQHPSVALQSEPLVWWSARDNRTLVPSPGATEDSIGTGFQNSLAIAAQPGNDRTNSAAVLALTYRGGGRNDWYLPNFNELWEMRGKPDRDSFGRGSRREGSQLPYGCGFWISNEVGYGMPYAAYVVGLKADCLGAAIVSKNTGNQPLFRLIPVRAGK